LPGPNLDNGKTATQAPSSLIAAGGPQLAVDGNLMQINDGKTCTQTSKGTVENPAWWQVDLGDTYRITGIKIYNRQWEGMYYYDCSNLRMYVLNAHILK